MVFAQGAQPQPVAVGLIFHTEEVVVCEIDVVCGVLDDKPDLVDLLLGDLMDVLSAQPVLTAHIPKAILVGAPGLGPVHHEVVEPFRLDDVDTTAAASRDLAAVLGPTWGRKKRWDPAEQEAERVGLAGGGVQPESYRAQQNRHGAQQSLGTPLDPSGKRYSSVPGKLCTELQKVPLQVPPDVPGLPPPHCLLRNVHCGLPWYRGPCSSHKFGNRDVTLMGYSCVVMGSENCSGHDCVQVPPCTSTNNKCEHKWVCAVRIKSLWKARHGRVHHWVPALCSAVLLGYSCVVMGSENCSGHDCVQVPPCTSTNNKCEHKWVCAVRIKSLWKARHGRVHHWVPALCSAVLL
ncbi:hypothetical protein QYF61_014089 [Mycteria americana]|uniref:Uncharacterized protein n=1 Tax=Mycteria americana TaxID=33587 RepID=A0AAN7NK05_MYCAM|nr:hypothetical protein QYF61_014089 [Mycteria americana]